jgi:integrase/recombinase XerD
MTAAAFSSMLAPIFERYVSLKRALGRRFAEPTRTLQSLDRVLHDESNRYPDLNVTAFQAWCQTQEHLASGTRRDRMMDIYRFCLYRRRTEPQCFLPDPDTFPQRHQHLIPYIFSDTEVARLLRAASRLTRPPASPLRPEVIRLAIVLLFTTGIRRGELLRLRLGDYNRQDSTLLIRESKFFKSRLLPINDGIADEIESYRRARIRRRLPISPDVAFIWNSVQGGRAYNGPGLQMCLRPLLQQCGILNSRGKLPRIHDFRHSFAVNVLLRWYRMGVVVDAKLPLLATYMGHSSAASTHYYLHFIEPLRTAASKRFASHYSHLIVPLQGAKGRR